MRRSKPSGPSRHAVGSINQPPAYREGLTLYWHGQYWHSHEAWENLWRESEGTQRHFLQALIQLDAALIHTDRGDWDGVANLLNRISNNLSQCLDSMMGMDIAELQRELKAYKSEIDTLRNNHKDAFNWRLKPRLEVNGITGPKRQRLRRARDDEPKRRH